VSEAALRRIQIREAIKAHFDKEQALFAKGIKVLDAVLHRRGGEVSRLQPRQATNKQASMPASSRKNTMQYLNEVLTLEDTPYNRYLKGIPPTKTHRRLLLHR
jgi:type III restriction enzyme